MSKWNQFKFSGRPISQFFLARILRPSPLDTAQLHNGVSGLGPGTPGPSKIKFTKPHILSLVGPQAGQRLIVRSLFRAKHHVVSSAVYGKVDEMSPAPSPLTSLPSTNPPPLPRPPDPPLTCGRQGGQGRITGKGLRTAVALSTAACSSKADVGGQVVGWSVSLMLGLPS